jgi:hypothetical protein
MFLRFVCNQADDERIAKLKVIDSLELSSREEWTSIVSVLIDSQEIKDILMKEPFVSGQAASDRLSDSRNPV